MKKVFALAFAVIIAASSYANGTKVSDKAQKAFETTFTDAENVVWTSDNNEYTVTFTQQGVGTFVRYDEQGAFLSSRRYYTASKLPIGVQCKIKQKFSDQTIFGVTEYTIANEVYYFVKLQDAASWTSIKVDNNGNVELLEKFNK